MRGKIIFLSLLAITLWACEEDIYEVPKPEANRFSVTEAKAWYKVNAPLVKPNGIFTKSANESAPAEVLNLEPLLDWDIAELSDDSVWEVVELPWEYEEVEEIFALSEVWEYAGANNVMPEQVIKLVVIRHRQTGKIYGFKMKIAPDLDYMLDMGEDLKTNSYLVRDSDLSGIIIFCTLDDRFINGWRYSDGVVCGKLVPANGEDAETPVTVSKTRMADWHIELDEVVIIGYVPKGLMHANMHTQEDGYLVFPPDDRERAGQVDIQEPLDLSGGSGNSNSDNSGDNNSDSDDTVFLPVPRDSIIDTHSLSVLQLTKLDAVLKELIKEGCMQQALYDALVGSNVKLNFGMATGVTAAASYDPRDRSIKFKNNNAITKDNLKEELFHAWQDAYYDGGIYQYRETGKVNVEFEAKLFKDLLDNPEIYNGCCYAFGPDALPKHLYNEYIEWIYDIRDSGNMSFQDNDYQKWLNYFQEYNFEYTSTMHPALSQPSALRGLINNSTCIN